MRFTSQGAQHDTDRMQAFPTPDPDEPMIYMDQQFRVFVERAQKGNSSILRRVMMPEIRLLAALYRLQELAKAVW